MIYMADGREVSVQHPELIAISPQGRTCVVWEDDAEVFGVIDLLLVTQLKVRPNGKPTKKNPDGKKRKNGKRKK